MHPSRHAFFLFVRHGATQYNLRGLRCGGDLDAELTEIGRAQSHHAADRIRAMNLVVRQIITSGLARARETACIIGEALGSIPITVEPLLNERLLGAWNSRPVAETEALLAGDITPPGGEPEDAFTRRVCAALENLGPRLSSETLVVSSSGVGRVIHTLLGGEGRLRLPNGGVARFPVIPDAFPLKAPEKLP